MSFKHTIHSIKNTIRTRIIGACLLIGLVCSWMGQDALAGSLCRHAVTILEEHDRLSGGSLPQR